jgi:hypothetical protein
VSALSAKQGPTPTIAIAIAASAGPTRRAEWIRTLLRLTALTTRSGPTISIAKLCLVGLSIALTLPRKKTSASTIQGWTVPAATIANRASAGSAITACVTISSRRLSKRSARRPPQAPKRRIGRNCSAVVMPTMTPLPVSERISQISATICIQLPESETIWPPK